MTRTWDFANIEWNSKLQNGWKWLIEKNGFWSYPYSSLELYSKKKTRVRNAMEEVDWDRNRLLSLNGIFDDKDDYYFFHPVRVKCLYAVLIFKLTFHNFSRINLHVYQFKYYIKNINTSFLFLCTEWQSVLHHLYCIYIDIK